MEKSTEKALNENLKMKEAIKGEVNTELERIKGGEIAEIARITAAIKEYDKLGITSKVMGEAGINPLHLENYKPELDFLSHAAKEVKLSDAMETLALLKGANIHDYEFAFKHLDQLRPLANVDQREGALNLLSGAYDKENFQKIFGGTIKDENFEFKDEIFKIKNIEKGFSFVVSVKDHKINFGVDGPGKLNWGMDKGGWWHSRPSAELTNDNIIEAKDQIEKMFKHHQEQIERSRNWPSSNEK